MTRFLARAAVVALCLSAWPSPASGQERDRPSAQASGTAMISGAIVNAEDSRQPVRRAIVTLSGGALPLGRTVLTDAEGRFAFGGLRAGAYTVTATKGGFLTTILGAKGGSRDGSRIVVAEGEQHTNVMVRLSRGAVISGTVTTASGEPASGLHVAALRVQGNDAQSFSPTAIGFVTDDRGAYRIFGLEPGDYYVVTTLQRPGASTAATARSAEEVDAIFARLRAQTQGAAIAPGPVRQANDRGAVAAADEAPSHGYAPVFFPGTANGRDAAIVSVARGQERNGVDIIVERVPTATIDGVISSAHGPLPRVMLSIMPHGPQPRGFYSGAPVLSQQVDETGRFRYTGVGPGVYTITARASGTAPAATTRVGVSGGGVSPPAATGSTTLWAAADVAVQGGTVAVALDLQLPLRLTGRATFQGTSAVPEPQTVRLTLVRDGAAGMAMWNNTSIGVPPVSPTVLRPDGTFEFSGVFPGSYRLAATASGSTWWLRSAIVEGRDILDEPLVFGSRAAASASLTFVDTAAEVSGRVQRDTSIAAYDSAVVVFPTNAELWLPGARRIRVAAVSSDGHFQVAGLPGGEYLVAVVNDVEPYQLNDRGFLARLAAAAVKITLADGEKKQQNLAAR